MTYSPTDMDPMREEPDIMYQGKAQIQPNFQLTPEENQIIKDCAQEGIYRRAYPAGISFGIIGYFLAAKKGILWHSKFRTKPAVIGFGLLGYLGGRFSYSHICIERAIIEVPNGTLRKLFPVLTKQLTGSTVQNAESEFYAPIDIPPQSEDQAYHNQSTTSDIDMPTMSNFDTVPSDYYADIKDDTAELAPDTSFTSHEELRRQNRQDYSKKIYGEERPMDKNLTSYEELRRQNRQDYTNKMYKEGRPMSQRYAEYPDGGVPVRRQEVPQPTQPGVGGGRKTKYGDILDV